MAKKNNPDEKKIKEIIDKANSSGANFIYRLKQEDRSYIPDWEVDGSIATHKMRAEIDNNGRAIVFPDVQEIGGVLYDFTDPKNGHKPWDSMDNAIQNNDTVIFDSLDDAIWFSENYKDYYPKFDKYKEGGKVSKWKPSKSILDYVKSVERFSPVIYKDGNGVETIGYGFTDKDLINKYRGKRMSKKEAERIFMEEKVPEFTGYVINYTENFDKLTDNQRDALFSYVYNIGSGNYRKNNPNLHKALQNEDWMTAAQYIDFGYKDEKNKGLRIRRNYERELFGYASDEEGNVYPIKTEEEKEVQEESVDQPAEEEGEKNVLLNSILGIKNDLEMQHPVSTTRDEAFREARKKGLKVFTWDGKKYNTKMKKDGGPVDEDGEDGGAKYRYIASMDNTSVGSGGINENANYNTAPISGVDISEVVAGGVPIVGDVVDVKDMYDSAVDRDALGMVMAAAGLIPVVGGIPKKAMQVKRTVKNMTRRDKELLKSLPEYAKPASPIGESWENHKKRLFSGAYEKLTGERLKMKNGGPDPTMLDVNIYNWDDPKVFNDAKYFLGDEYSDDEIREIIDGIYGYGILNGNIVKSKNADELIDSFIESNPGISNDDIENFIKSHEVEHSIHYPDSNADKNGFDLNRVNDREVRDYFKEDHFTEMAARGTQIKNYFGLTDDSQEVTPEMLEYAAMNYLKDYGYDNNMKEYFESISDYKKAAKWITDHASVGIGSYYIDDKVSKPKKEKKRDGGSLTPYKAGFRFLDHKKEYGDPKDISRRIPSRKFMYFYIDEKPEMEEGGFVPDWMLQRNKLINRRGMSRCKNGGEANRWWEDPEGRDRVVKRQKEAANRQEKRRRLIDQAYSDLENGEIDEDEFRRIVGFSNSGIGDLIISKDGNGEEIGAIINSLLNNIDVDKVKKGIDDAKKGMEDKNKEDAYPYKLMAESLLTLADVASSTPGMLRLYNKMGLDLMPILKTIAESSKIQTIAGLSNIGIDGSQIALDPEGDNAFNYAGILGGAAEAIGGTNVVRNMSFMGRYGNRVDDVLDIANPIISTLGVVDDVSKMEEGGVVEKQREAYDYFTNKRGMSKIQALAIIGNLMAESGLKDDIYGDNRTSYGIQQWHNERMDKLFKHARKKGHSTPTFKDQLEFLADEYEGKTGYSNFLYTRKGKDGPGYYNYSKQDFQNAETLQDAVIAWNQGAGRPHKSVTRNTTRYELAKKAAANLGLKIEEDIKPRYGQMGFDTDFTVKENPRDPQGEVFYGTGQDKDAAGQQVPIGAEASGIAKEDMFKLWTETYGKDIVANLMSLKTDDSDSRAIDEEYEERYKQYVKESEEDKKRALIEAILPGLQLKIKGMTD